MTDLKKTIMQKRPLDIEEKYFKELKAKGEESYFKSDFIMFIRDEYMKDVKEAIKELKSCAYPRTDNPHLQNELVIDIEDIDEVLGKFEEQ